MQCNRPTGFLAQLIAVRTIMLWMLFDSALRLLITRSKCLRLPQPLVQLMIPWSSGCSWLVVLEWKNDTLTFYSDGKLSSSQVLCSCRRATVPFVAESCWFTHWVAWDCSRKLPRIFMPFYCSVSHRQYPFRICLGIFLVVLYSQCGALKSSQTHLEYSKQGKYERTFTF